MQPVNILEEIYMTIRDVQLLYEVDLILSNTKNLDQLVTFTVQKMLS